MFGNLHGDDAVKDEEGKMTPSHEDPTMRCPRQSLPLSKPNWLGCGRFVDDGGAMLLVLKHDGASESGKRCDVSRETQGGDDGLVGSSSRVVIRSNIQGLMMTQSGKTLPSLLLKPRVALQ